MTQLDTLHPQPTAPTLESPVTDQEILAKLDEIIADQLDLDDVKLSASMVSADVEGWDSLAHVRIMIAVEQAFGVRFSAAQIAGIANVGELIERIRTKL